MTCDVFLSKLIEASKASNARNVISFAFVVSIRMYDTQMFVTTTTAQCDALDAFTMSVYDDHKH